MLVSIIIPVYRAENYLPRCIQSIQGQSFSNYECILVDDGSPDHSGEICDLIANSDTRFRVIHKSNGGASSARNTGIEAAKGEWITFVDADDYLDSDYLELLVNTWNRTNADLVAGGHKKYRLDGSLRAERRYEEEFFAKEQFADMLSRGLLVYQKAPWCKLFNRNLLKTHNIRFVPGAITGEDEIFLYSYFIKCQSVAISSCTGYNYIEVEGALTKQGIFPYRNEVISLTAFSKISKEVFHQYPQYEWIQEQWSFYVSKVINAIYHESVDRKERIARLQMLDLKDYYRWRKPATFVEKIMLFLLGHGYLTIFDILMTKCR